MSNNPFRVFRHRDYAMYFSGQLVSQAGTWMQQIAVSWLTYRLTNSPFLLAVVAVSSMLPSLVLMPFAGVISDRFNRHRLVVVTQCVAMIEATVLAWLTLTNQIQIWQLIGLELLMGLVNAFDMPVRSAFIVDMVQEYEDLPAAIAMNSSLMNLTRLFGPALAGFLVASVGEGICFAINAASYIFVIGALLLMQGDFTPKMTRAAGGIVSQLMDGVKYAISVAPIRAPIILLALFGFGGMAYVQLLPVFVKNIGGDAHTLGYLSSASALGSICGTAILATRKRVVGLGRLIVIATFTYSAALISFSFTHSFLVALPILFFIGMSMMLQMGCSNTILQSVVDPEKRGRVMSLFTLAFMGTVPLGALTAGWLAARIGFSNVVLLCGLYCLCIAIGFATQLPRLRRESIPLYIERGLLEVTEEELDVVRKPSA